MCTERENDFIARLMQGEFNLYTTEFAPTLTLCDLRNMCSDLENKANDFAERQVAGLDLGDLWQLTVVKDIIAEAYKQGYRDNELVCHNKECNQRIPPCPYRVGDKVTVTFPNGNKMTGRIAEVKWNGWCDIDFGNGFMRYDASPCELELTETD